MICLPNFNQLAFDFQADIVKKISAKNPIIETVKALLDRSCHMLVDSESLQILLKFVKTSVEGMDDDDDDDSDGDEMNGTDGILSHKAKRGLMLLKVLVFLNLGMDFVTIRGVLKKLRCLVCVASVEEL